MPAGVKTNAKAKGVEMGGLLDQAAGDPSADYNAMGETRTQALNAATLEAGIPSTADMKPTEVADTNPTLSRPSSNSYLVSRFQILRKWRWRWSDTQKMTNLTLTH